MPDYRGAEHSLNTGGVASVGIGLVTDVIVDESSVYLDVEMQPQGFELRAKWAPMYAGKNYGIYFPIQINDQVVVVLPDGDPNGDPVAITILHNEEDNLPSEALAAPEDIWIVAAPGRRIEIKGEEVTANGVSKATIKAVQVNAAGSALTVLGDLGTLTVWDGVLTGRSLDPFTGLYHYSLGNASTKVRAKK